MKIKLKEINTEEKVKLEKSSKAQMKIQKKFKNEIYANMESQFKKLNIGPILQIQEI